MFEVTVESLYNCFNVISSNSSSDAEKLRAYQQILQGSKGGPNEKKLSSQFIGRFFKLFQTEQENSFNCLLDLCDDEDSMTRIQAVRDFQQICKSVPTFIPRVSDVLAQLIITENVSESNGINNSLKSLLIMDPSSTLVGIFNQIMSSKSGIQRKKLMQFLMNCLKDIPGEKMTIELEEFIIEHLNHLFSETSSTEFDAVIVIMSSLKSLSTLLGRQRLVNMVSNVVMDKVPIFDPQSVQSVELIQRAGKQIVRLLSKNVSAAKFLKYMLVNVVPLVLSVKNPFQQRGILQILTNFSSHPGDTFTSVPEDCRIQLLQPLYMALLTSFPEPSTLTDEGDAPAKMSLPAFTIECFLYTLLNLLKFCPTFLCASVQNVGDAASQEGVARLHSLRHKAQYTARLIQSYKTVIVAELQASFQAEGGCSVKTADEARRALANIEKMVRCIFRSKIEPYCLQDVTLSWIEPAPPKVPTTSSLTATTTGAKRPASQQQGASQSWNKRRRFQHLYRGSRRN
nr:apoptosis inhibitor 5 [Hymenolepis microstoma]